MFLILFLCHQPQHQQNRISHRGRSIYKLTIAPERPSSCCVCIHARVSCVWKQKERKRTKEESTSKQASTLSRARAFFTPLCPSLPPPAASGQSPPASLVACCSLSPSSSSSLLNPPLPPLLLHLPPRPQARHIALYRLPSPAGRCCVRCGCLRVEQRAQELAGDSASCKGCRRDKGYSCAGA